jgi:teichuronic acid biosynthesis glycosyltransferase TuaG
MKDLVSIIIPYYKKKKFFQKTVKSIKKQSYKNFEVILIFDDTDKSDLNFINHNLKNFKKKKIIINKKNQGVGISRNLGLKKSKGKFIAFLDADDVWHKDKIKKQVNFMKENKIDFSFCSYFIIQQNDKVIKKITAPKKITYEKLLTACDIGLSTVMISSKLIRIAKFSAIKTKEDYLLWLKLSKKNIRMLGFNKTLVRWRKTDNSLSSSTVQKLKDAFLIFNRHLKFSFIKSIFNVLVLSLNFLIKRHL